MILLLSLCRATPSPMSRWIDMDKQRKRPASLWIGPVRWDDPDDDGPTCWEVLRLIQAEDDADKQRRATRQAERVSADESE